MREFQCHLFSRWKQFFFWFSLPPNIEIKKNKPGKAMKEKDKELIKLLLIPKNLGKLFHFAGMIFPGMKDLQARTEKLCWSDNTDRQTFTCRLDPVCCFENLQKVIYLGASRFPLILMSSFQDKFRFILEKQIHCNVIWYVSYIAGAQSKPSIGTGSWYCTQ